MNERIFLKTIRVPLPQGGFAGSRTFLKCIFCKKEFSIRHSRYIYGEGSFCSNKCRQLGIELPQGEKHYNWGGGKIKSHGYVKLVNKKHPRIKSKNVKYVFEHILVMEKKLGRYLKKGEFVHHVNHIKKDNRIENLMLVNAKQHIRIHRGWWQIENEWWKTCKRCTKDFQVNTTNFYKRSTGTFLPDCKKCCNSIRKKHL